MTKVMITGTHFTPALAVIEELKKHHISDIIYVGRKTTREGDKSSSIESKAIPSLGVKFIPIITGRLQHSFTIYTIPSLFKIPIGLLQAFYIVLREKPDIVLSFGGYVSVPIVFIAWLLSIPIITHEQTLVSGLANRINGMFADKIALSFKNGLNSNNKKLIFTGNPIRQEISHPSKDTLTEDYKRLLSQARKDKLPIVFVTGGNQGSHIVNLAIEQSLPKLLKIACIIHQTGESKFKDYEKLESKQGNHYLIKKFIGQEIGAIISVSTLVVSRAGVNTLLELAYLKKPALVIPIPYIYQDEQNKNAKYFESLGLVKILPQHKLSGETLYKSIKEILNNLSGFNLDTKQLSEVVIPDADKRLVLETLLLVQKTY